MPEVIVHSIEGPSREQIKALCKSITEVVMKDFGAPAEAITVTVVTSPRDMKSKGGVLFSELMGAAPK